MWVGKRNVVERFIFIVVPIENKDGTAVTNR